MSRADLDAQRALYDAWEAKDCRDNFHTDIAWRAWQAALASQAPAVQQEPVDTHPDNKAIERFAVAMKHKMAISRDKGRSGWDDEEKCSMDSLATMLVGHIAKGDPVDIANFAMMLHQREAAAMEHHPCYGNDARRALSNAAPSPQGDAEDALPWLDQLISLDDRNYGTVTGILNAVHTFAKNARAAIDAARKAGGV